MTSFSTNRDSICPLDVAASYLEVVQDDLIGSLQEEVCTLSRRYFQEVSVEARDSYWEEIRHTLRGLEGIVSECVEFSDTFRAYARARFDKIWNALSINERNAVIGDYKFEDFGDERIRRPNFLDARRTAWMQTKRRIDNAFGDFTTEEKAKIVASLVDNADVGFAMCEYVYAIDDYEGAYKKPEVERLLDVLMDAIRAIVFPLRATRPDVELEEEESFENKDEEKNWGCAENEDESLQEVGIEDVSSVSSVDEEEDTTNDDDEVVGEHDCTEDHFVQKIEGYYQIDEYAAANAKRAISFDPYISGSETRIYRAEVDKAREIASERRRQADERYHSKINSVLERFERRLADWYDQRNRVEASYPSVLIVGADNFSYDRHEKKMKRLAQLYETRDKIFSLLTKIEGIGLGGIRSDDPDAIELLELKLKDLKTTHEKMKSANLYLRRFGSWDGFDDKEFIKEAYDSQGNPTYFYLINSNQEMRRIENRIETLKRQAMIDYGDGWKFSGGVVKANKEEGRLQIFFDEKPGDETLRALKGRGFKWSSRSKAWQRMLTLDTIWAAKSLGFIPKDWRPTLSSNVKKDS